MQNIHRVIITDDAINDLERAVNYVKLDSPQNASGIAEVLLRSIDSLEFMPHRFRLAGKARKTGHPVRAMVVRPFILYYRIDERAASVHVLRVIHGARRQPKTFG